MPSYPRVALSVALVVVAGAVAGCQVAPASPVEGQPSPAATVTASPATVTSPSPTPGWAERFPVQTADKFTYPFTYAIDPSSGFGFAPCCQPNEDMYQFRIPEGAPGEWSLPIVVVDRPQALRTDYCHDSGGTVERSPSPEQFVDFMASVQGLVVTKLPDLVIDGRTAKGIDVRLGPRPSSCGDLWLFEPSNPYNCCQPDDNIRRTYAIEVDRNLVNITIPFTPANKDRTLALAGPLIDSFRFVGARPSPSSPGGS